MPRIGSLPVSAVGLGCNNFGWRIDEAASRRVVDAALDAGVTHFDTADSYDDGTSERFVGRALGARRGEVVIATKFGNRTGGSPATVRRSVEASLSRLGTDVVDLVYLHKPDPATPIADTLGALAELVVEGKVREIGCSNFSEAQLREADAVADAVAGDVRFVALQNEYSLLHRAPESGMLDVCRDLGVAFVPFFPLKSGLLTGKYRRSAVEAGGRLTATEGKFASYGAEHLTPENLDAVERLIAFAESRGRTILELAFAYLLAHAPVASVIAGATTPEQVVANVAAADGRLSAADLAGVEAVLSSPA